MEKQEGRSKYRSQTCRKDVVDPDDNAVYIADLSFS